MGMISQSGLGSQGQKIGQEMIHGYENWINSSSPYFPTNDNPFIYMAMRTPMFMLTNPSTMFVFHCRQRN